MVALDWTALEVAGAMIESRAIHFNTTDDVAATNGFQFQNNSTSTFANELKFAAAKSVRTSIVTLASFNVLAAFLTASGIFWHSYKAAKKRNAQFSLKTSLLEVIAPADTFPFILSLGIIVQGITFAYVQSRGFQSLSILDCMHISQAMLPAMFITLYIQLVLGVEMAVRAVMTRPFQPRGRWILPGCLVLILLMLLGTFLVTVFNRPPNFCFASLFWLVHRWKLGILIVLSLIMGFLLLAVGIIGLRLRSTATINEAERLAAYRMVFYLSISVASLGCLLPFFIQSNVMDLVTQAYELSKYGMVASVVANLSGIITGGCYVFLRSKKVQGVGPTPDHGSEKDMWLDKEKDPRTQSVDSDDRWLNQIQQPLTPPHYKSSTPTLSAAGLEASSPRPVYERRDAQQSSTTLLAKDLPQVPNIHIRKSSNGSPSMTQEDLPTTPGWVLPAATYTPLLSPGDVNSLVPPPAIRNPDIISYRRRTSLQSTATVQIGLRLSNVNDVSELEKSYQAGLGEVHNLNCPNVQGFRETRNSAEMDEIRYDAATARSSTSTSTMSVIISQVPDDGTSQAGEIRLSPTVYSPQKPASRQSDTSLTSEYEDDTAAVPDPLFTSRKGAGWI
ncbi:hypothetical protein HJFPF1_06692 [Paramyrothecium foliicola]|nr:hypothetical protein HJFPF1_06692 [Paramyrothecium foliicola]